MKEFFCIVYYTPNNSLQYYTGYYSWNNYLGQLLKDCQPFMSPTFDDALKFVSEADAYKVMLCLDLEDIGYDNVKIEEHGY